MGIEILKSMLVLEKIGVFNSSPLFFLFFKGFITKIIGLYVASMGSTNLVGKEQWVI